LGYFSRFFGDCLNLLPREGVKKPKQTKLPKFDKPDFTEAKPMPKPDKNRQDARNRI